MTDRQKSAWPLREAEPQTNAVVVFSSPSIHSNDRCPLAFKNPNGFSDVDVSCGSMRPKAIIKTTFQLWKEYLITKSFMSSFGQQGYKDRKKGSDRPMLQKKDNILQTNA